MAFNTILEALKEFVPAAEARQIAEDDGDDDFLLPLINLGYLDLKPSSEPTDPGILETALRSFIAEANEAGFSAKLVPISHGWAPDNATVDWMQDLISVEGEFSITALPVLGERSLWSRVLHFRLWVFGKRELASSNHPWTNDSISQFWAFAKLFNGQAPKTLLMLGDINVIIKTLLGSPNFFLTQPRIAIFRFDSTTSAPLKGNKKQPFWDDLQKRFPEESKVLKPKIESASPVWLKQIFDSEKNVFLLRLVRIYQWVNGYYYGDLGPSFHEKSFQSLLDLAEIDKKNEIKSLIISVGLDYWAMNIFNLFQRIDADEIETIDTEDDAWAELGKELENRKPINILIHKDEDPYRFAASMNLQRRDRKEKLVNGFNEYRGTKSIMKTAKKFIVKFWDWLKRTWDKITGAFRNLLGFIFRGIRKSYRCLADGLVLLFGKRIIKTEAVIVSDFAFDFDLNTVVSPLASVDAIDAHGRLLRATTGAMNRTLDILGKIINLIINLAAGPTGWIQLGMRIAKLIKDWALAKLKSPGALATS